MLHLEADMYFINPQGEYQFNGNKIQAAHAWCLQQTRACLQQQGSVVVSNTFTQLWEIRPYHALAVKMGVEFAIYQCTGQYPNIHNVPDSHIKKMRKRWHKLPQDLKKYLK